MNDYAWAGQASALFAIVAGILICFFGYRILKLTLGLVGLIGGGFAGWELGMAIFHGNAGLGLVCALIVGVIGLVLCLWLYLFGVFWIGAAAGTVLAAAFVNGTGHQLQPLVFIVVPVICGLIALVAQKLMIVVWTAFSGSYLLTAGVWPFIGSHQRGPQIWLHPSQHPAASTLGYGALIVWIVVALVGIGFQFRGKHRVVAAEQNKA
ncbi:MAG TPA: DUF4203 domain-containing protein [Verrucomicrobiae bacterium]|nr:DUF4203 domain-containing protein [Verrucomicrobiae bacterium]